VSLVWTLLLGQALAKSGGDVTVKVVVHDPAGAPIPTAVVRHPREMQRHRVNSADGSWQDSVLYMPDGSEMHFVPGMRLELEISAPGYMTQVLTYDVKKRRNLIDVTLPALVVDDSAIEEPTIGFGRDNPREPGETP
jgi:hypothetical protein